LNSGPSIVQPIAIRYTEWNFISEGVAHKFILILIKIVKQIFEEIAVFCLGAHLKGVSFWMYNVHNRLSPTYLDKLLNTEYIYIYNSVQPFMGQLVTYTCINAYTYSTPERNV
jgi:hypothetical protein